MTVNEKEDVVDIEDIVEAKDDDGNDTTDWKALAFKNHGIAQRFKTKFEKSKEVKEEKPAPVIEKEPTELDYSQKAFLIAKGVEEFDIVLEEAKKFGGSLKNVKLEDLISNPYFQQKLEAARATKANELAADGKSGRGGNNASSKDSPDYWLAKLGPNDSIPEDIPREVREKIVDARRKAGKDAKMFYND